MKLNHDSLICHVGKVNGRNEKHGEDTVLAVDVALRLMEPEQWAELAASLWGIEKQRAAEMLHSLSDMQLDSVTFSGAVVEHKVNFRQSNKKLATLSGAKVNKVVMRWGESLGMTFRVQAQSDGDTIGHLMEAMGEKVRVELVCTTEDEGGDPAQMQLNDKVAEHA